MLEWIFPLLLGFESELEHLHSEEKKKSPVKTWLEMLESESGRKIVFAKIYLAMNHLKRTIRLGKKPKKKLIGETARRSFMGHGIRRGLFVI